ncbi:L-aspartate oxidase [Comamonas sp. GB3 AK4-5]|uniref:L-aspartate oxidase n=1 Tax=Comamonas sp. GB3 AK4-5 TaxID=3231487 RepID=UPI00351E7C43
MQASLPDIPRADVLIIGAGLAGLSAALSLPATLRVVLLSKGPLSACASAWAQGGIAAVLDANDSLEAHVQDTLNAGAGHCRPEAVRAILAQAPDAMAWLCAHGVPFTRNADGSLHLTREGGHGQRRIAHAADCTGHAVHGALLQACRQRPHLTLVENATALELLTAADGRCAGALVQQADGMLLHWAAGHTVLASGGLGRLYSHTTNPEGSSGDGVAMAWRAGCAVEDLEFLQFHPTALQIGGHSVGLVTEALRGEGALLRLPDGQRFMPAYDARAELAPRDIVARAIASEMARHGLDHVLLDIRHRPRAWLDAHFPGVTALCAAHGLDLATQAIPVAPCMHYACGGVRANVDGSTGVAGLSAIGEVACTGLHGANRLASNSLLECVVTGRAAGARIGTLAPSTNGQYAPQPQATAAAAAEADHRILVALQQLMQTQVGLVRQRQGLEQAVAQLDAWRRALPLGAASSLPLRNRLDTAWLIASAALQRGHSLGAHARSDAPLNAQ